MNSPPSSHETQKTSRTQQKQTKTPKTKKRQIIEIKPFFFEVNKEFTDDISKGLCQNYDIIRSVFSIPVSLTTVGGDYLFFYEHRNENLGEVRDL